MNSIKHLIYLFTAKERVEGALLLTCMAIAALLEAGAISSFAPLVAVLMDPERVFASPFAQRFITIFGISTAQSLLIDSALAVVAIFIAKSVFVIFMYRWLFRFVHGKQARLTRQLIEGYMAAPYTFHLHRNTAELIKGTSETMQRFIHGFLLIFAMVTSEAMVVAALLLLLLLISPLATISVALVFGGPAVVCYRLMRRQLDQKGRLAETSMTSMMQWTEQAISSFKETLVLGRTSYFVDRHSAYTRDFAEAWRSFGLLSNIPRLVVDTLAVMVLVGISLSIAVRGQNIQAVLPMLGVSAVAAIRLMPSVTRISQGMTHLRFHYVTIEVLYKELREIENFRTKAGDIVSEPVAPTPFKHAISIDGVSYEYPGGAKPVIHDISLVIKRGRWVAFMGPTGAGKSTLVELILGLFIPSSGRILVDGQDMRDSLPGWRRNIGYVPQEVYLIDDTIRRNVAFGLPDEAIDDDKVWRALAAAHVEQLVRAQPQGLEATVGQRGERLSGGERQRLGLARALYDDPELLIVDEGTANLDPETESAIAATLGELKGLKTIIVIAHRLALVRRCDEVFLLREGKLCKTGAFGELMEKDAAFRQFVGEPA